MWTRANLKAKAKAAFKRNYWKCVLIGLILGIVAGGGGSAASSFSNSTTSQSTENILSNDYYYEDDITFSEEFNDDFSSAESTIFISMIIAIILIVLLGALALQIFIFAPLEVGCRNFFKLNAYEHAEVNAITYAFNKNNYMSVVKTLFFRNLYTALWTCVFIIPGIIKSYEYRMIPYILADCPGISKNDAFRISREMMNGNKMDAFVLDLSFFGWLLLTVITCGAVGLFYVNPYIAATDAELFLAIREEYFNNQRVVEGE